MMTPIEFDGITKIDAFLEREDSSRLFQEILQEITWIQCDWNDPSCAASYVYTRYEKELTAKKSLEDITSIVEAVLETSVSKLWLWCYGDGDEHMCYRSICANDNLLHVFIGVTRKLCTKDQPGVTVMHRMKHGDALYVPAAMNSPQRHYSVPSNDNIDACTLHLCFSIAEPYSFRHKAIGKIHLLGRGVVEVTYDTRKYPNGLPPTIATLLPEMCVPAGTNTGGISLIEEQFQPDIFQGIAFTRSSLQDLHSHLGAGETSQTDEDHTSTPD